MILEATNSGATNTRRSYSVYLSYSQLRDYLVMLIDSELVEYIAEEHMYKATSKGLDLLKMYNETGELLPATPTVSRLIESTVV